MARARISSHVSQVGHIRGKFSYMPPEQACGGEIDQRVDIFSVGAMLYDMDFAQVSKGPAQRILVEVDNGRMTYWQSLPGGTIFDPDSPHYDDLLKDFYLVNKHFLVPWTLDEVNAAGEERWLFEAGR